MSLYPKLEVLSERLVDAELDGDEIVVVLDDPTGTPVMKSTTAQAIADLGGVGYLEYVAILTQVTTNHPVASVVRNVLSGIPAWTRVSAGNYKTELAGAFPDSAKVFWMIPGAYPSPGGVVFCVLEIVSTDRIDLHFTNAAGIPTDLDVDSYLYGFPIEIRVYP